MHLYIDHFLDLVIDVAGGVMHAEFDEASQSLFHLGRAFGRLPLRDLLASPAGGGAELSAVLVVQAVEAGEAEGQIVRVGDVAARLGIDPSTASRLVAQAMRSGYLRRGAAPRDRRVASLELTEEGRGLSRAAARYQRSVFDTATQEWSDAEKETFARLFVRFAAAISAALESQQK